MRTVPCTESNVARLVSSGEEAEAALVIQSHRAAPVPAEIRPATT